MSGYWQKLMRPMLFRLDAEHAHELGIKALRLGLAPGQDRDVAADVECEIFGNIERFGLKFSNPFGIAAGFDKNAVVVNRLVSLGFGFVEVGTVTYDPQPGNPRPRLFRLPDDGALINRLGFNNDGAERVAVRLKDIDRKSVVGVNIGRNKNVPNEEATENYLRSFDLVHPVADYIAVNISSPNTPGLRELQKGDSLDELLAALQSRNVVLSSRFGRQNAGQGPPEGGTQDDGRPGMETPKSLPLLVKIAPDLTDGEIEAIADVAIRHDVAGVIATNTTISRNGLRTVNVEDLGAGGLSGKPLKALSTHVIAKLFRYSNGKLPIVGVGGISTAADAFEKVAAGASLLQAYTGFVYGGPTFAADINRGLARILKDKGFGSLDEAVGTGNTGYFD